MDQFWVLAAVGAAAFAATNIDDLIVLLAFFSDPRFAPAQVVAGQYLGMIALIGGSVLLAALAVAVSPRYVGLAGFVPLGMGIARLWRASPIGPPPRPGANRRTGLAEVAVITLANGGDNLGTYVPLFSSERGIEIAVLAGLFLVLTGLWCLAAYALVQHPAVRDPLQRRGRSLLPWVLMGLGVYILVRTGALTPLF